MKHTPTIDVAVTTTAWAKSLRTPAAIARKAALAALAAAGPKSAVEVSVALTSDSAVRKLNASYRGKDMPTNVLSFPAGIEAKDLPRGTVLPLGDVAVAYGACEREAKTEGKSLKSHLSHLMVHGVLHLLGYDHEDDADARTMERLEKRILARLGIADPYGDAEPQLNRRRQLAKSKPA